MARPNGGTPERDAYGADVTSGDAPRHPAQPRDRAAFDALARSSTPALRRSVRRVLGHPDDTEEVVQEALLRAWQGLDGFRGDASFSTWLCAIGVHLAVDRLRARSRWRREAQVIFADRCTDDETLSAEVVAPLEDESFAFDVREHVAHCFGCVARSLPPEQHAALVLRDVLGWTNAEAARALGLNQGALRHRLADARAHMTEAFEGLCALVSKEGICWQCHGLRELTPEPRRGPSLPVIDDLDARLRLVRAGDGDRSRRLHDLLQRRIASQETRGLGDAGVRPGCGRPGA